jgi:hypothetical protein
MLPLVDQAQPGPPGDRRDDIGVVEDRLRIVDRRLIELDRRLELIDQRARRVDLLLVDGIAGGEPDVALQVEFGIVELRRVLRLLRHHLIIAPGRSPGRSWRAQIPWGRPALP